MAFSVSLYATYFILAQIYHTQRTQSLSLLQSYRRLRQVCENHKLLVLVSYGMQSNDKSSMIKNLACTHWPSTTHGIVPHIWLLPSVPLPKRTDIGVLDKFGI